MHNLPVDFHVCELVTVPNGGHEFQVVVLQTDPALLLHQALLVGYVFLRVLVSDQILPSRDYSQILTAYFAKSKAALLSYPVLEVWVHAPSW